MVIILKPTKLNDMIIVCDKGGSPQAMVCIDTFYYGDDVQGNGRGNEVYRELSDGNEITVKLSIQS